VHPDVAMDTYERGYYGNKGDDDHQNGEDKSKFEIPNLEINTRKYQGKQPNSDRHLDGPLSWQFSLVAGVRCNGAFYRQHGDT
jgi:hypothetical protein